MKNSTSPLPPPCRTSGAQNNKGGGFEKLSRLVYVLAYGPWGPLHRCFIFLFRTLYGIQEKRNSSHKKLGDFFLRDAPIQISAASLVSPVEALVLEGPSQPKRNIPQTIKGLKYLWDHFEELNFSHIQNGTFWNFYLAPQCYHWVHAPASGKELKGFRHAGTKYPVNRLGRWLTPNLYTQNERLTFYYHSEIWGHVYLICIGAMGVSALLSQKGTVIYNTWTPLSPMVQKGERLLGFQLGSTVLLLTEKLVSSMTQKRMLRVGNDLVT